MTIDDSVQNLARANNGEGESIISKIEPIKFTASGKPYTDDQLKRAAPFTHVQNIIGKV